MSPVDENTHPQEGIFLYPSMFPFSYFLSCYFLLFCYGKPWPCRLVEPQTLATDTGRAFHDRGLYDAAQKWAHRVPGREKYTGAESGHLLASAGAVAGTDRRGVIGFGVTHARHGGNHHHTNNGVGGGGGSQYGYGNSSDNRQQIRRAADGGNGQRDSLDVGRWANRAPASAGAEGGAATAAGEPVGVASGSEGTRTSEVSGGGAGGAAGSV